MFDAVRNNKRIVQFFLALIILPFAFWGVDSLAPKGASDRDVATVGGSKITQGEYQQAIREQQEQMRQALGPNFNPAMMDSPGVRKAMLDQLVNQRVLLLEAAERNIVIGDDTLREFIASAAPFQANGKFSMERYQIFLQSQGKNQVGFEYELRQDLLLRQLAGAISESSLVSQVVLTKLHGSMVEKRSVQELRFSPDAFRGSVKVADDDVQKYYDANPKEFEEQEQVKVEYVTLSMNTVKAQAKVSEAEVKARFEGQKDRFQGQEERRASHILIQADQGNVEARKKAKAKAEELLTQVKSKPVDFGKLAKQHSQDPGSAALDGDLGFFKRGMMVKPFEDATFALKEKEISGVVESDFGYHIIQLTGVKTAKGRSIEEARPEIEAELKQEASQKHYAEAAEAFSNMVYEQTDSLKPAVERFKVPLQTSEWLRRGASQPPSSPFAHPKLAAAVFSDDVVKNKRNTEAVEVQSNTLVSARLVEHKPATLRAFDSVKTMIRDKLQRNQALAQATKAGEAKLAELRQGKDAGNSWGAVQAVSRVESTSLPREAIKELFKTSAKVLPAYAGLEQAGGGYLIYKISAVDRTGSLDPQTVQAINREVAGAVAQEEMNAYLTSLRSKFKVEINKAALESSKS